MTSPDVAGYRDGGARRRTLRGQLGALVFIALIGLLFGWGMTTLTTAAEWGRAFGAGHRITGTVVRIFPNVTATRTCTMDRVALAWNEGPALQIGYFDVCTDEVGTYPVGDLVTGWAPLSDPKHDLVGVNLESRGNAIFGVVLEILVWLGILLTLFGYVRSIVRRVRAPRLLARGPAEQRVVDGIARTFPNGRRVRGPGYRVIFGDTGDWALVVDGKAERRIEEGDVLTVVPTGRSLFRRRPVGPVGLLRDRDQWVFWANSLRRPKPAS